MEGVMISGWQLPPKGYTPVGPYGPGGQFPMKRLDDLWMVIDESYKMHTDEVTAVRLHDDRDDPNHVFLPPEAWRLWPNRRRLSDWYNASYKKSMRLRNARSTNITSQDLERIDNEEVAKLALLLQDKIIREPDEPHTLGWRLDWSPSGQVWKDGERWVLIPPPSV
jgi:hypothetical protein